MTNEGVGVETEAGEELDERSSMVAYVGRASFRMVPATVPGNDNHEQTLRIRIPVPQSQIDEPPLQGRPYVSSGIGSLLVARLEVRRWILATMTLLVFASGMLAARTLAGGARPTDAPSAPVVARPVPTRPTLALIPIAEVARREPTIAPHAPKPTAAPAPTRRRRKPTAPQRSAVTPRPEAVASGWVDPFAQ